MSVSAIQTKAPARPATALPRFRVGQIWHTRTARFGDEGDYELIVAITTHTESPIITQSPCGATCAYRIDGQYGEDPSGMDLVTLAREAV